MLHESRHVGNALRGRPRQGRRHPLRARSLRRRGHRGRRRLLAYGRQAGGHPAPSGARARQRPGQSSQRTESQLGHRQHRRRARHVSHQARRAADFRYRGHRAPRLGVGAHVAKRAHRGRRRSGRHRRRAHRARPDRHPHPARRHRVERGGRRGRGSRGRRAHAGERGDDRALRESTSIRRAGHDHADRAGGARARTGPRRTHRHHHRRAHPRPGLERAHPARRGACAYRAATLSGRSGAGRPEGYPPSHPRRRQGARGVLRLSRQAQRAHARRLPDSPAVDHGRGLHRRPRGARRCRGREEERRGGPAAWSPRAAHGRPHPRHPRRRPRRAPARRRHRLRRVSDHRSRILQARPRALRPTTG